VELSWRAKGHLYRYLLFNVVISFFVHCDSVISDKWNSTCLLSIDYTFLATLHPQVIYLFIYLFIYNLLNCAVEWIVVNNKLGRMWKNSITAQVRYEYYDIIFIVCNCVSTR